jgi:hypothetical protein
MKISAAKKLAQKYHCELWFDRYLHLWVIDRYNPAYSVDWIPSQLLKQMTQQQFIDRWLAVDAEQWRTTEDDFDPSIYVECKDVDHKEESIDKLEPHA